MGVGAVYSDTLVQWIGGSDMTFDPWVLEHPVQVLLITYAFGMFMGATMFRR